MYLVTVVKAPPLTLGVDRVQEGVAIEGPAVVDPVGHVVSQANG